MFAPFVASSLGRGSNGPDYAAALAAITNVRLLLQADQSTAANGATLNTTPFVNSGTSGGSFGSTSCTWETGSQNGLRGVVCGSGASNGISTGVANPPAPFISTIYPEKIQTTFLVARLTGANASLITDRNGGAYVAIGVASGVFNMSGFDAGLTARKTTTTTFPAASGDTAVIASRVVTGGAARLNYKGSVQTFAAGSQNTDGINAGLSTVLQIGAANYRIYEVIVSNDAVSDSAMDTMVLALMSKWGIT